jgi:hypothetical protein
MLLTKANRVKKAIRAYAVETGYHVMSTTDATLTIAQRYPDMTQYAHADSFEITRITTGTGVDIDYTFTVKHFQDDGSLSCAKITLKGMRDAMHFCAGTLRNAYDMRSKSRR